MLNHRSYCERHGYDYKFYHQSNGTIEEKDMKILAGTDKLTWPGWIKVIALMKYISQYDYVMWVDLDTIFLNEAVPITEIIASAGLSKTGTPFSVYVQQTIANAITPSHAILFHNSPFSRRILSEWWGLRAICPEVYMDQGMWVYLLSYELMRVQQQGIEQGINTTAIPHPAKVFQTCNSVNRRKSQIVIGKHISDNSMNFKLKSNDHPNIYYFYLNATDMGAPSNGFTCSITNNPGYRIDQCLTIHPCKTFNNISKCFKVATEWGR
eukprot:CAMPEP_0167745030 /NCGR_PEP_ID=MMETSP0110_2-20121227/2923_1 /TAXON_ID=629695 /ORGANISM="Gymnochlora sp., Strain CCMP2014" /LENGTH=266 /DNA_ID=CAMNT_0007629623 /DNA_START=309 /DNA_END=1109 /DNA_ORIENTATION=-